MTDLGKAPDARQEFTCRVSEVLFELLYNSKNIYD